MGKLFDESGRSLTPSHTAKGERRSRYYVSRSLIEGSADAAGRGWRLPAPEIERTIAASGCRMLGDRTAIAAAAQAIGLADRRLPLIFPAAAAWNERLQSGAAAGAALDCLANRVDLTDTCTRVSLNVSVPNGDGDWGANGSGLIITRFFPVIIRRLGVEMRLAIDGDRAPAPRTDMALLKAVARAYQWSKDLLAGRAQSVAALAERELVSARYVRSD